VAERQDPLVVWGDGKDVRDVIYVDDFVDASILAAEKIGSYDPLNIGAGKAFTVDHILGTLLEIEGFTPRVIHDRSKPSMIPVRLIDTTRAKKLLGFRPKTALKDGLKKTVDWYKLKMPRARRSEA